MGGYSSNKSYSLFFGAPFFLSVIFNSLANLPMKSVSLLTLSTVSSCRPLARVTPPPPSTAPGTSAPTSWAITPTWRRGGYSDRIQGNFNKTWNHGKY